MKYVNAWIEEGYFDERAVRRLPDAEVEIGMRTIRIEWHEGLSTTRYEGVRNGQGHFLLRSDNGAGSATLHRFQHSTILEGFWKHSQRSGFWRVHLPDEPEVEVVRPPKSGSASAKKRRKPARRASVAA